MARSTWASVAGGADLERRGADLGDEPAQLEPLLADALGRLGPGLAELLAVLLDVRLAGVGQGERRAALAGLGADEPLVLELLERRVDRAGARAPGAVAAALDLLHQAVAGLRLLVEQDQQRGADVAAAHAPPPSAAPAARPAPLAGVAPAAGPCPWWRPLMAARQVVVLVAALGPPVSWSLLYMRYSYI